MRKVENGREIWRKKNRRRYTITDVVYAVVIIIVGVLVLNSILK